MAKKPEETPIVNRPSEATQTDDSALTKALETARRLARDTEHLDVYDRISLRVVIHAAEASMRCLDNPIRVVIACPICHQQHVDQDEWATRPHRVHRCVAGPFGEGCGHEWYVASVPTVGVRAEGLGVVRCSDTATVRDERGNVIGQPFAAPRPRPETVTPALPELDGSSRMNRDDGT